MCNALGIITYNDSSVYVEGMQKYRPIAGFSFLGPVSYTHLTLPTIYSV